MSDKLLPCLHCGHKKYRSYKNMEWKWVCKCDKCGAIGPPAETKAEAIGAWNRRYVCPDKNGKPVYAGDKVWVSGPLLGKRERVTSVLEPCVLFDGHPTATGDLKINDCEIEFIEESEREGCEGP